MLRKIIYLDNSAQTPTDKRVAKFMFELENRGLGNPSSLHQSGRAARAVVEEARNIVASLLSAKPDEIIFTGSGSESDNLALIGIARALKSKGRHIISSPTEHPAVLEALAQLTKEGFEVEYLGVDNFGQVSADQLLGALRNDTILVSLMYANNEIGTLHPIEQIGKAILRWRKKNNTPLPYFHSDACQAFGYYDLSVDKLHVDALTINSSKIYGPKGVGALYVRRGVPIMPIIYGGLQERALRAGTHNVSGIAGFAYASKIASNIREKEFYRLIALRDYFIEKVQKNIKDVKLNGHKTQRLPNNVHFSFLGIEGEAVLLHLDAHGICVSAGSACASERLDPSHVLMAICKDEMVSHGGIRFSFGRTTTKKELNIVIKVLPNIVSNLRNISSVSARI